MARAFKRLLSLCSALAMTVLALPVTELPAAAQETETEAQLLYGDINLDGVIDAEDSSALSQAINKKTASELVNADLNGDGKVNNSDALMLSQFVSGELAYFPVGDVYIAGVSFVTRGEWIHSLVTAFDMSVEDRSSMETYFTDLSGNAYAEEIELAANFGVFEAESDEFSPDAMVTREFAAHTANFCIGYLNETVVSFADSGDIFYEDDASVAVLRGWFAAIEHQFRPALYMNSDEADVILGDLKGAREADTIRTDAPEVIEYADSVIQVDDSVDATLVGNTVTINSDEVSILAGDIFTVNIDGTQCLYKASSVSIGKNGQVVADVEEAPLEDAVSNVNIQGIGEVDYSNITYYSDGTDTVQTNAAGVMYLPRTQVLAAASSGSNSVKLDHTFDLGGTKVYLSGTLSNIQPEYKLQWNGLSVDSFTLNMKADANFTAKVSDSFTSTKSKEVKIASVPVACGGLLTAEVGIYITVSLSGEIQVSYSCDVMGGVTYTKDGGWRTNRNFQKKSFTLDAKASESIAIKASASVKFATTTLGNAYVMVGEKGTIQANKRETGLECATLRAYVFAEYGASLNLFGLKTFSNSTEFINESNSPVRIVRHWENDVLVDHCTYGEDLSYSSSTKKKRRNYTTYSNYGTEYEGIITLSNSSESRSDGSVTRWEGSITLTKDTEVYGDLFLTNWQTTENGKTVSHSFSSLDLDGYSLTVYGDIIQTQGTVTVNNGTLNVYGGYVMRNATVNNVGEIEYNDCSARLYMANEHDKVNISGDFTTHRLNSVYNVRLYYGVFSVAGDIWTDGGVSAESDRGNRIVLNGSGTQKVYTSTDYTTFNQLEVTDPGARQIVYGGKMKIRRLGSDINILSDDLNLYSLDLNQKTMTITGDTGMTNSNTVNLNGGILTIRGNFLHKTGTITCNNGTLNVTGNYTMENATTNNVGETEYNSCSAYLNMNNEHDKVNISGDFTTHNLSGYENVELYYGVFSVAGDVWTDGGVSARYDYGNRVILNGSGTQRIYTSTNYTTFNQLEATDPEARQIVYSGDLYIRRLGSDINIKSDDLNLRWADLNQHTMTITG
ncbi:MAG: hypothetical protein IJ055_00870, partial [Oscillospiraceae bacterium]|nr:hypothetical protein [Oscillospiraceae bacterium]